MHTVAQPITHRNQHDLDALFTGPLTQAAVNALRPAPAPALPEAACSLNLFTDVPGYGKVQVTGRGATGTEAAHNLKASVDALHAAFAPVAVPTKLRLADVLACGIAKAVQKGDWDRIARLGSAAALVVSGAVCEAAMPDRYTVLSRTQTGVAHDVNSAGACGCKDYQHRATEGNHFFCAHGLAVLMLIKLQEQAGEA